jgi:hypothetical protein
MGPVHWITPSCSMATRSAMARTELMSCVMVMAVAPISVTISRIRSLMTPAMIGSSPVVGSSKKMISGSAAMARARPTRFCIPPDSSAGKRSATSGLRPTRRSFSMAISRASAFGRLVGPRIRRKATFSQTRSCRTARRPGTACRTGEEGVAVAFGDILPVQRDGAAIMADKPEDAFQQHRFAGARSADDDHALPRRDGQVHPAQDAVLAEGLGDVGEGDHAEKNSSVRM